MSIYVLLYYFFMEQIVKEKRLGPIPLKIKETKLHQRRSVEAFLHSKIELDQIELERSKRPIRLLPLHIL